MLVSSIELRELKMKATNDNNELNEDVTDSNNIKFDSFNSLDDNYISDDDLDDLTKLDNDRPMLLNLAGPSLATKAINRVRRLKGQKTSKNPLKAKYINPEIFDRIKDLEEEFEKEKTLEELKNNPNLENKESTDKSNNSKEVDVTSLFYNKAMARIENLNMQKNEVLSKIKRNFRIFIIIIVAFAGYYSFSVYTHNDEELSLMGVKAKLPLKLDLNTTLTEVNLDGEKFSLKIVKAKDAFKGSENIQKQLDLYVLGASSNFCKVQLFSDMIKSGKKIFVSLDAEDKSYHREFSVGKCEN